MATGSPSSCVARFVNWPRAPTRGLRAICKCMYGKVARPSVQYGERERPEHLSIGLLIKTQVAHAPRTVPPDATHTLKGLLAQCAKRYSKSAIQEENHDPTPFHSDSRSQFAYSFDHCFCARRGCGDNDDGSIRAQDIFARSTGRNFRRTFIGPTRPTRRQGPAQTAYAPGPPRGCSRR